MCGFVLDQFTNIKVSNYQERLIIIDDLTHLQKKKKKFKALLEIKKENTKGTIKCSQYNVTIIMKDEFQ